MTEAASQREMRLEESHLEHAALAQLHLWLQQRDAAAGGLSAHFLKASDIQLRNGAAIAIDAEIECLNADPGDITTCSARCHALLQPTNGVLPKIADIRIAESARQHCERFRPA